MKKRATCNRGQASIFVLMIFSLLFMFFGMSINIAMLVHHKINLQNAADMAAMAGAAEQARVMNMIAWKNYELRKNFKDFMYAYWVEFNDRHYDFPDPRHQDVEKWKERLDRNMGHRWGGYRWTENPTRDNGRTVVPSYCFGDSLDWSDDPVNLRACDAQRLPVKFPRIDPRAAMVISSFDPFYSGPIIASLNAMAADKEFQSRQKWNNYSKYNEQHLRYDIYTYSQRAEDIYRDFLNPGDPGSLENLVNSGGTSGNFSPNLGLWNIFTSKYLDTPNADQNMQYVIKQFKEKPHDIYQLAFQTALKNLNEANRRTVTDAFFTPLVPKNGYLSIQKATVDFTMFWTKFQGADNDRAENVSTEPQGIDVFEFPVAIEKLNPRTFYAVTLKTQPDLPFLPAITPWKLTAVAAAQPFGSRIGPKFDENDFRLSVHLPTPDGMREVFLPHICLGENCNPGFQDALDNVQNLHDLKVEIDPFEGASRQDRRAPILYPSEWEATRYNLPDETSMDHTVHPTDKLSPYIKSGNPYSLNYAATNILTSWNPNRAGYGIKLIPVSKILDQLDPAAQSSLSVIGH